MNEKDFLEFLFNSPPLIACFVALAAGIAFLFRLLLRRSDEAQKRISELEREFRAYISEQGARTTALLERATKVLENLNSRIGGGSV